LRQILARYQESDERQSWLQVATSVIPFLVVWYLMVLSLDISYLLTLALAVVAAGFMIRTFIIFHDCGHGSFFADRKWNDIVGVITGILTVTPYYYWRHDHAVHHATAGDLDRRGTGDVQTLTVDEYRALSPTKKFLYRALRNPLILVGIGPFVMFAIIHRFSRPGVARRERMSVYGTNLALAGIVAALMLLVGWKEFLLVQVPILVIASSAGVWLFYVQHNFVGSYWERHKDWDYFQAGLKGSSFYQLPGWLQWFTGNIGFHHIHHLSSKIPNYRLAQCHRENPEFQVDPLTIRESLVSLRLRFWDEARGKMVGYEALRG
jgi:omega-6 fatty acid desaturase (delta-12 desaturase)